MGGRSCYFIGADGVRGGAQRNEYTWGICPDGDCRISGGADRVVGPYEKLRYAIHRSGGVRRGEALPLPPVNGRVSRAGRAG